MEPALNSGSVILQAGKADKEARVQSAMVEKIKAECEEKIKAECETRQAAQALEERKRVAQHANAVDLLHRVPASLMSPRVRMHLISAFVIARVPCPRLTPAQICMTQSNLVQYRWCER